ncbi:hypothetical protein ACWGCW_00500 [Streptomyces sp. NPDC054933]
MSTATDSVRRIARHALPSRRDLNDELRRLRHEKKADTTYVRKIEAERDAASAEVNQLTAALTDAGNDLADARHANQELQQHNSQLQAELTAATARIQNLIGVSVPATLPAPEDEETAPIDTRAVRETVGDDYLDRTRQSWIGPVTRGVPLHRSPLAAVVDPGQVTDDTTVEIPVLRLPAAS